VEAARDWQIDRPASFMVGDRWTDIEAGRRAGCRTVFVDHGLARVERSNPDFVEVTTTDRAEVIRQAQTFAGWADNIVVKVPIHGPEGEWENLEIVHELETRHDIRVNVTAMMSAQQCFLAALAGATYVSIFGGRVNNTGYNACGEITKLRQVLDQFGLKSQIIVGSTREVLNVIEWLEAGAHIVTVVPHLLEGMLVHSLPKDRRRAGRRNPLLPCASVRSLPAGCAVKPGSAQPPERSRRMAACF
jgi:transaldolase